MPHRHSVPTRRSSDLLVVLQGIAEREEPLPDIAAAQECLHVVGPASQVARQPMQRLPQPVGIEVVLDQDRKSTRLNSSHLGISYAVFCLKKNRSPSVK